MLFLQSSHYDELKEVFGAGLPVLFAALGLALLFGALAVIPPSALPAGSLADFLAPRRRHLTLLSLSICVSTLIGFAIVYLAV